MFEFNVDVANIHIKLLQSFSVLNEVRTALTAHLLPFQSRPPHPMQTKIILSTCEHTVVFMTSGSCSIKFECTYYKVFWTKAFAK